jgi:predicted transcriptional regulator
MPGKTISAYTDEETAKLIAELARTENRKPSQIAAEAIALYVRLPAQVHASLRRVQGSGEPGHLNLMLREVSRAIVNASFDLTVDAMIPTLREIYGDTLQTEEEINAEAVRLTSRRQEPSRTTRAVTHEKKAADTAAKPRRRSGE